MNPTRMPAACLLAVLLYVPVSLADPWHKYADRDAYWHHGSGWVWTRQVEAFELVLSPYQIEGNDDVGSEYVMERDGVRRAAFVDLYFPSSAAPGAKLATALAELGAGAGASACARLGAEEPFPIEKHPEITGVRVTSTASKGDCALPGLYFFQTADWVVTVRTSAPANDGDAAKVFDAFVRALQWDTLNTDPHGEGAGS